MTTHQVRHQIESKFAATLAYALGVTVEVTLRADSAWTVCGSPSDVTAAVSFLTTHTALKHERTDHDDELGESFAYFAS